jgi:4-amino-4-deoxy-L-arabinose transferase-like glycosyltransferase
MTNDFLLKTELWDNARKLKRGIIEMKTKKIHILVVLLLLSLTLFLRYPFVKVPVLDTDESVYIDVADNIMNGGMPYKDAWDHKPPLIYYLFDMAFMLFGKSISGVHIFTIFYITATSFLMYIMVSRIWGKYAGIFAGISYPIFLESDIIQGLASNTEIFMNLFIIAGIYFFMKIESIEGDRKTLYFVLSGLFIGIATLTKQPALFVLLAYFIYLFYERYKFKDIIYSISLILSGFFIPIIIVILYFYFNDALSDFIYSNFTFNAMYVGVNRLSSSYFINLINSFPNSGKTVMNNLYLLFILAFGSIIYKISENKIMKKSEKSSSDNFVTFLILWLISSLIGVFSGTFFFFHYYIQLLPSLIFLASYSISVILEYHILKGGLNEYFLRLLKFGFMVFLFIGFLIPMSNNVNRIPSLLNEYDKMISDAKHDAILASEKNMKGIRSNSSRSDNDYQMYYISEYIKLNSNKGDYIFVWGNQPIIYFLSERKAASKYVFWSHINNYSYTMEELTGRKPKFIVYEKSWTNSYFEKPLASFIDSNYTLDTSIDKIYLFKYNSR